MNGTKRWEGIFFESSYFIKWYLLAELKQDTKLHAVSHLKAFQKYLYVAGFEGELDFNKFFFSEYSGQYSPIDEEFIDGFIEYLQTDTDYTAYSIYNIVSYLKNFFGFIYDMEMIESNPMEDFRNRFYKRPAVDRALSVEECSNLLSEAVKIDPFFRMHFTMIWVMLTCALRRREIIMLNCQKVLFDSNFILIDEGQKSRASSVAIPPFLANELHRLLNHPNHIAWREKGNDQLFFFGEKPLTPYTLSTQLHRLCKNAGIERRVTTHDFRRTTGYLMQKNGVNIMAIKRQLRHRFVSTTLAHYLPHCQDILEILDDE